ncbi:MAG: hypothetical protein HS108_01455 [Planctomycetes bacterium]|jgi:hypothetical protein|nr:hypothetical protein [Planctomycetota bacterium]MCL4730506.1 hypothetical protein [Planctomycetota bacterium]
MPDAPLLCPCCAAHLYVPAELHAMRCNFCDAELVRVDRGGVCGLALVPPPVTAPPYCDPAQWQRRQAARAFDGALYVQFRRNEALAVLGRRRAGWAAAFWACVLLLAAAAALGLGGLAGLLRPRAEVTEPAVSLVLAAFVTLPLAGYVALYFQGRARLLAETMRRYRA